jgi:aryl-alcohol dehydrogenase-like predicted oxidoreductase
MKVNVGSLTSALVNLQFARSASGIIAPLAGQKHQNHVSENLALAKVPPLTADEFMKYFLNQNQASASFLSFQANRSGSLEML